VALNAADVIGGGSATGTLARLADRWIYVFMAALFVVTALCGFVPDSIGKLAAVRAGQRPPLPLVLHVHAVLMGSWLLLLLAQTTLVATGRRTLHKQLGMVAFGLVPAIVLAMVGLVITSWHAVAAMVAAAPAGIDRTAIEQSKWFLINLLPNQIQACVLFALFTGWAIAVRRSKPETHKRLMILATLMPLPAAIDRIAAAGWLPTNFPAGYAVEYGYMFLWLMPVLIYDIVRRGRVHSAYVIGLLCNLPFVAVTLTLYGSPWWAATAPKLMGVKL
jgi:hypothetical protein